jgi:hypothetical protein
MGKLVISIALNVLRKLEGRMYTNKETDYKPIKDDNKKKAKAMSKKEINKMMKKELDDYYKYSN